VDARPWMLLVLTAGLTAAACAVVLRARTTWRQVGPPRDNPCHRSGRKLVAGLVPVSIATLVCLLSVGLALETVALLGSVAGLALVGHLDDRTAYTAGGKLVAQLPFFLLSLLVQPGWGGMAFVPGLMVGLAFAIVITNGMNVLDVADGLAPGVSAVTLGALGFILLAQGKEDQAVVALVFAGGACGFLLFNAAPGRLILGDAGCLPLGGLTAALVPQILDDDVALGLPVAALLLSAPLFEVSWVSVRRLQRGLPPWVASPHHLAYWLVSRGMTGAQAVGLIVAGHALAVTLALWLAGAGAGTFWAVLVVSVLAIASWTKSRWLAA